MRSLFAILFALPLAYLAAMPPQPIHESLVFMAQGEGEELDPYEVIAADAWTAQHPIRSAVWSITH
jgi:hypothetical protein